VDPSRVIQIITQPYTTVGPSATHDSVVPFFRSICNYDLYHLVPHFISPDRRVFNIQPSCKLELNSEIHTPSRKSLDPIHDDTKQETKEAESALPTPNSHAHAGRDYRGSFPTDHVVRQNPLSTVSMHLLAWMLRVGPPGSPTTRSGRRTNSRTSPTDAALRVISGDRPGALQAKIGTLSLEGQTQGHGEGGES
jgi:hypothetical protein